MQKILERLGIRDRNPGAHDGCQPLETKGGEELVSENPADGRAIARVVQADEATYEEILRRAAEGFKAWRSLPAPKRGEVVRQMGEALRAHKEDLGSLVSLEMGKIHSEGLGEVQEMIDIADFAVGLSRQLYGLSMHSERPGHRMYEQWHPLGIVGVVTAFNFPVAVWAWNSMIATVCGDAMVWKPSSKTPLTAVAVQNIIQPVCQAHHLDGVFSMIVGRGTTVGERLINDRRVPLISATGSCRMGRRIGRVVAERLGRSLLELGGNNGILVMKDADLDLTLRAVVFGSVGTAGQRCTSTRRLFVHEDVYDGFVERLTNAFKSVRIGNPLDPATLMGPLIDKGAVDEMMQALAKAKEEGGRVLSGGEVLPGPGHFVQPTLVAAHRDMSIVREETFAPILYVFKVSSYDEALEVHNSVDQGLSSAVFTNDLRTAEAFLSPAGSDCGIANVNIGTSGAEIGGAFGGEKDTGGGREAGSDSWKVYMRRQTVTVNYSTELPLAQGVSFDL